MSLSNFTHTTTGQGERTSAAKSAASAAHDLRGRPKEYRWILPDLALMSDAEAIVRAYGVHPLVGRVLAARGWAVGDELGEFLQPLLSRTLDPMQMKGMGEAVERLLRARDEREPLLVYGDYDVDGITATALLVGLFRHLNIPVCYYIPSRLTEGYGLHVNALEELSRAFRLVVTVDTGITAVEEADWARRHGIDLVVTDHHRPGDTLPEALAIVNPNQPGCPYPDKNLAGVGVAFKLAHALLKADGRDPEAARRFLREQLDLVAVGTICDLVPLVGENRTFVRHGLRELAAAKRPGFKALKVICGFEYDKMLHCQNIGYGLGPRLNAAGRTANPKLAIDLLATEDESEAFKIAEKLEKLNDERRQIERKIVDEVMEVLCAECDLDNERVLVCGGRGWHLGVIGIVASRILDRYHRPTIICAIDEGVAKGSGRSIEAFDLHSALVQCGEHLLQFGGHAHAAGVRLEARNIGVLREALNALADEQLRAEDMIPKLRLDAEIQADEVGFEAVDALGSMAPYGQKNKAPLLLLGGMKLDAQPRVVGRNHLKLRVRRNGSMPIEVIGFNLAHHLPMLADRPNDAIDLAGVPKINEYRGLRTVQFEIKDLRPAG